jgi:hypothetical protein
VTGHQDEQDDHDHHDHHEERDVLRELLRREPLFHHPELGTTRADFEAATAPDYWEVGASGRVYDREFVWNVLAERYADPPPEEWVIDEPAVRRIGADTWLLTYRLLLAGRWTRRATIWQTTGGPGAWLALYHQGTVIQGQ